VAVGLGQAGGNLAAELARRGYRALAFNTASTDLSSLASLGGLSLPEEQRCYIGVDGHDGAGSDATYGRQCIAVNAGKIRERVSEIANGADIVLITCGLGGGTGSAVAEMVKVLEDMSLPLLVLATLPSDHESGIAKVNAVRAVNELVKEHALGWIFVDNARLAEGHGDLSLDRYYTEINKLIVEPFDALNHLNERPGVTPIRTLDGEDLRALLLSSGLLNFDSRQMTRLTTESVIGAVRECVQFSNIMPQGYALESVSYLGLVLEAPDSVLSGTPFSFFEQLSEQLKEETGGGAIYLGVYRDNSASSATVRLVCSTQALPEGMREMVSAAKREGAQLRDKLQQTLSGLDLGEIEEYELFRTSPGAVRRPRIPEQPAGAGARRSVRPPAAAVSERVVSSVSAAVSIPPPGSAADRETYDQMVREYKNSGSEDVRKRVLDRLESDRRSDNSLVRYYAVRAMTKLDPALFADALRAATEDEDATVRAIATKALQQQTQQRA
jgi:cell division GTPase FtsZ